MGRLIDGEWVTRRDIQTDAAGRFIRADTQFRDWVSADESSRFPGVAGRYHLYVSLACPWAHRTLIVRALEALEDAIDVTVVDPFMGDDGWAFTDGPGHSRDPVLGVAYLRELYVRARPGYSGRVTVPVLWDKQLGTIVNNESREIIRMFDTAFAAAGARDDVDLYPEPARTDIEAAIDAIYNPINNGVYRCGFAGTQAAYDEAVGELFAALDHWEGVLGERRFVCGDRLTLADVCLFTTLVRFDAVYHFHFKCNLRRLRDYPNLWGFTRDVYQLPGVAETCDFAHIKQHYYRSHESINPRRIVPAGPILELAAPHDRARLTSGVPPV